MMKKTLFALLAVCVFSVMSNAGGGSGGPLGGVLMMNLSGLDGYISAYSSTPFSGSMYTWGGSGASWLSKGFGLGVSVVGGFQTQYGGNNNSATFYSYIATYNLENVLFETKRAFASLKFGVGYSVNRLVLRQGLDNRSEYSIDSLMFPLGVNVQFKFSEVTRIEVSASYYLFSDDEWILLDGSAPKPPGTKLDCFAISLGVRFGSGYFGSSGSGVYIQSTGGTEY